MFFGSLDTPISMAFSINFPAIPFPRSVLRTYMSERKTYLSHHFGPWQRKKKRKWLKIKQIKKKTRWRIIFEKVKHKETTLQTIVLKKQQNSLQHHFKIQNKTFPPCGMNGVTSPSSNSMNPFCPGPQTRNPSKLRRKNCMCFPISFWKTVENTLLSLSYISINRLSVKRLVVLRKHFLHTLKRQKKKSWSFPLLLLRLRVPSM